MANKQIALKIHFVNCIDVAPFKRSLEGNNIS